jgi:hypothetical protein
MCEQMQSVQVSSNAFICWELLMTSQVFRPRFEAVTFNQANVFYVTHKVHVLTIYI